MTKRKSKSTKTTVKAAAAKGSVNKSSAVPATAATPPLIVLGYDDQQKPRGARFVDAKPDLVTKAADLLGFKVYEASEDVADRQETTRWGGFMPTAEGLCRTSGNPCTATSLWPWLSDRRRCEQSGEKDSPPAARGLPVSWDEIGPGHLVIAQEFLEYGWWEAIVVARKDDVFMLRYRDFPSLPSSSRDRFGIALMYRRRQTQRPVAGLG